MRTLWFLLCLALSATPAAAQFSPMVQGPAASGGSCTGGYLGAGDLSGFTWIRWYGLRAYSCADAAAHGSAIQLKRADTGTTATITYLSSGALDTATAATFCSGTTCGISGWYDRLTGAMKLVQPTAATAEQYSTTCLTVSLCFTSNGSQYDEGDTVTIAQQWSVNALLNFTNSSSSWALGVNGAWGLGIQPTVINLYAGSVTNLTTTINAWHSITGIANGGTSIIYVDNSGGVAGGAGTNSITSPYDIGGLAAAGQSGATFQGLEFGFTSNPPTGTVKQTLCTQQSTYWGLGLSC